MLYLQRLISNRYIDQYGYRAHYLNIKHCTNYINIGVLS